MWQSKLSRTATAVSTDRHTWLSVHLFLSNFKVIDQGKHVPSFLGSKNQLKQLFSV